MLPDMKVFSEFLAEMRTMNQKIDILTATIEKLTDALADDDAVAG